MQPPAIPDSDNPLAASASPRSYAPSYSPARSPPAFGAFFQAHHPGISGCCLAACPIHASHGTDDQQPTNVDLAGPRDLTLPFLAARRKLSRHEAKPGGKACGAEGSFASAHLGRQRHSDDRPERGRKNDASARHRRASASPGECISTAGTLLLPRLSLRVLSPTCRKCCRKASP
jgi:hypothetical protein